MSECKHCGAPTSESGQTIVGNHNVMFGGDGAVQVMDFGARAEPPAEPWQAPMWRAEARHALRVGVLVGGFAGYAIGLVVATMFGGA